MIVLCLVFQVLECGVCEDVFSLQGDKVPRLLLCGHTVCHDCLTRLPLHGRAVRCPFDRQVTELGELDPYITRPEGALNVIHLLHLPVFPCVKTAKQNLQKA